MTDEEYVFRQDIRERKAAGRGAYHKKCGSKSKYVRLPSDNLTNAEKKRRNGEVKTYNINKCITNYADFKELPTDLMHTYITNCRDKFGAMGTDLAASMNVRYKTFSAFIAKRNLGIGKGGRRKLSPNWRRFVLGEIDINGKELIEEKVEEPKIKLEDIPAINWVEPEKPINITDDNILLGAFIGAIIEALKGSGAKLTIELTL